MAQSLSFSRNLSSEGEGSNLLLLGTIKQQLPRQQLFPGAVLLVPDFLLQQMPGGLFISAALVPPVDILPRDSH